MKIYRNFDTGVSYTIEELKEAFEQFYDDIPWWDHETFEEYLEQLLSLGRNKQGGLEEIDCDYAAS